MKSITRFWLLVFIFTAVGCGAPSTDAKDRGTQSTGAIEQSRQEANDEPPSVMNGFIFRPRFKTTYGSVEAGTGFVISIPGRKQPLFLSALHLLGPAGGLDNNVSAGDVERAVSQL